MVTDGEAGLAAADDDDVVVGHGDHDLSDRDGDGALGDVRWEQRKRRLCVLGFDEPPDLVATG